MNNLESRSSFAASGTYDEVSRASPQKSMYHCLVNNICRPHLKPKLFHAPPTK